MASFTTDAASGQAALYDMMTHLLPSCPEDRQPLFHDRHGIGVAALHDVLTDVQRLTQVGFLSHQVLLKLLHTPNRDTFTMAVKYNVCKCQCDCLLSLYAHTHTHKTHVTFEKKKFTTGVQ